MNNLIQAIGTGDSDLIVKTFKQFTFTKKHQLAILCAIRDLLPYTGSVTPILELTQKHSKGIKHEVAKILFNELRKGGSLAGAMKGWFDPVLVESVALGEKEGVLTETLQKVLASYSKQTGGAASALKTLIYPVSILTVIVAATGSLTDSFAKEILKATKGDLTFLPADLAWLMSYRSFLDNYLLLSLLGLIVAVIVVVYTLPNWAGAERDRADRMPGFNLYAYNNGARFMQVYAILKSVGATEYEIIHNLKRNASPYLARHLNLMSQRLDRGVKEIVSVVDTGMIKQEFIDRLRLLAGSKNYLQALEDSAEKTFDDYVTMLSAGAKVLSAALILLAGYIMLKVVFGMMAIDQLY